MKLGVMTVSLGFLPLDEACKFLAEQGVQMVEIGCGGNPGKAHCDPKILLNDDKELDKFRSTISNYGLEISGLSCHGNYIHPNKEIAASFDNDFTDAILLAEKLGVDTVNCFSGCPGDQENAKYPNWVTCSWPEDFRKILDWQWSEVLIPYWKQKSEFAKQHNVTKFAIEMHPGFCVYNVDTLLRLREAVGDTIGANLDPSHLIWQGADLKLVIRELGRANAIYHFHAKDTRMNEHNTGVNGVLDTKPYGDERDRSWIFRTVGYGHDMNYWKDIASELRLAGYDHVLSIEHEDSLMSIKEGLTKAIKFLQEALIFEDRSEMFWA